MLNCSETKQNALIAAEISIVLDCGWIGMYTKLLKRKSDEGERAGIKDEANRKTSWYISG